MDEKLICLIAVFDDETQRRLSMCYKSLAAQGFGGRQTKEIPYHLTLASCGPGLAPRLAAQMDDICTQTEQIDIRLANIGLFGLNVLFIAPNINIELLALQRRFFASSVSGCHPWAAHATLLMDEPDEILRALPVIVQSFEPFDACITALELYELFPAKLVKRHDLKKNKGNC